MIRGKFQLAFIYGSHGGILDPVDLQTFHYTYCSIRFKVIFNNNVNWNIVLQFQVPKNKKVWKQLQITFN